MPAETLQNYVVEFKWEINTVVDEIINCMWVNTPHSYQWTRQQYFPRDIERGDKWQVFFRWRKWMKPVWEFNDFDSFKREATDSIIIDNQRFFFVVRNDKARMQIRKQCWSVQTNGACEFWVGSVYDWTFVNITPLNENNEPYFDFNACCYDKFTLAQFCKWKIVDQITDYTWVQRNHLVWNTIVSSVGRENWQILWWDVWNFVYVYDAKENFIPPYALGIPWQARMITEKPALNEPSNYLRVEAPWVWLYDHTPIVTTDQSWSWIITKEWNGNEPWEIIESRWVCFKIFEEYWDVFVINTAKWPYHYHYDTCEEYSGNFTKIAQLYDETAKRVFLDIKNWNGQLVCLDSNWIANQSAVWLNQALFIDQNDNNVWQVYTWLSDFGNYLLLTARDRIGILYRTEKNYYWWYKTKSQVLLNNIWTWWRYSYANSESWFYFVSNNRRYYWLSITYVNSDNLGNTFFTIDLKDYDKSIRTDLSWLLWFSAVDSWKDECYMQVQDWEIMIFINTEDEYSQNWVFQKYGNTKILIYDEVNKYWHKRYMKNMRIRWLKFDAWYWSKIYINEWYLDDWQTYPQVVKIPFGDQSSTSKKIVHHLIMSIWWTAKITNNNTILKITIVNQWWQYEMIFDQFERSERVKNMMKIYETWSSVVNNDLNKLIDTDIFNLWLFAGKAFWYQSPLHINTRNEINDFFEYENISKRPRQSESWCYPDEEHQDCNPYIYEWEQKNVLTSDPIKTYTLSKYWILQYPMNQQWDLFTFEFIARDWDILDLWWIKLWWEFGNQMFVNPNNVLTYPLYINQRLP